MNSKLDMYERLLDQIVKHNSNKITGRTIHTWDNKVGGTYGIIKISRIRNTDQYLDDINKCIHELLIWLDKEVNKYE